MTLTTSTAFQIILSARQAGNTTGANVLTVFQIACINRGGRASPRNAILTQAMELIAAIPHTSCRIPADELKGKPCLQRATIRRNGLTVSILVNRLPRSLPLFTELEQRPLQFPPVLCLNKVKLIPPHWGVPPSHRADPQGKSGDPHQSLAPEGAWVRRGAGHR